ncbi:hypothetical protein TSAR_015170 [Trichomalopsis sarcophagae]|uniref:Uncharacterized protein n=1 Tax=Trichomalopsis sarcophagae TaxID=543379 RepID=A0A232FED7_9HYME|nr:hypothetical protein TSAR_015170 [Trichomalopsis sarcophagae]
MCISDLAMWKLESAVIVLSALFCFGQCQVRQGYVDVAGSLKSYAALYNISEGPRSITWNGSIYTVILGHDIVNLTSIVIDSDQPQHELSCELLLTPDIIPYFRLEYRLQYKVVMLGNGKLVFVMALKLNSKETCHVHAHIIIDPYNCSNQKIVKVPCQLHTKFPPYFILIPYQDSYDVIMDYGSHEILKNNTAHPKIPQRFNDKGENIELDYSIEFLLNPSFMESGTVMSIDTIKPFDVSEGYFSSYEIFRDNGFDYVLQRLNSRFEIVKEIRVRSQPHFRVSTTQGHINYCTAGFRDRVNITCKLLNADLEVIATSELPKFNIPGGVIFAPEVINLPNDRGLVVFIPIYYGMVVSDTFFSMDFYLQRVDASGSALPYYWKLGHVSWFRTFNLQGSVDSKTLHFCYEKLGNASANVELRYNFDINCLDLYAH